jgi:hypothetical protein
MTKLTKSKYNIDHTKTHKHKQPNITNKQQRAIYERFSTYTEYLNSDAQKISYMNW